MISLMRYFTIIFLITCVLGCVPYSDNPITDPSNAVMDQSILGTWFWKDEGETGYIHIGRAKEPNLLRIIMVEFGRNGQLKSSHFSGHISRLKGNKFLNLQWTNPPQGKVEGFLFVKYEVKSGSLGIGLIKTQVVQKAIEAGEIKGTVKQGKWHSEVRITEDQRALQDFILTNEKRLFPEMNHLKKLTEGP